MVTKAIGLLQKTRDYKAFFREICLKLNDDDESFGYHSFYKVN